MKTFLIINTSYFGDTILTGSLCRNIKLEYPDSKLVFIVNTPFHDAARYMEGVDEVWDYDKRRENKGLSGLWRFYREYKQRYDFEAAFIIYGNQRNIILSKFLGARKIYANNNGLIRLMLENGKINYGKRVHTQDRHASLLELHTKKIMTPLPIHYQPPEQAIAFVQILFLLLGIDQAKEDLVAVCATTKQQKKDMKIDECVELIHGLREMGKTPLLVGSGKTAVDYVKRLQSTGCDNFIDLTNRTSIAQLGAVMHCCSSVVSVDTGTMHLALALDVPVVAVFHKNQPINLERWAPKSFYRHRLLADGLCSAKKMLEYVRELDKESKNNVYTLRPNRLMTQFLQPETRRNTNS